MDELEKWSEEYDAAQSMSNGGKPQSNQRQYHPTIQKIAEYLMKHPELNKAVEVGAEYSQIPGALAGGAVQSIGDMGASLANLGLMPINAATGRNLRVPHPNIRENLQLDPGLFNDLAFGVGELAGGLVGGGGLGTGRGIVQGLQRMPRSGGWMGLGEDVLKGMGTGYALGETNNKGEGRLLGALIGGIAQPISSITNRGITNRVLGDRERALNQHGQIYENIFDASEEAGAQLTPRNLLAINNNNPGQAINRLLTRLPQDHRRVVEEFMQHPTMNNAQLLQSDLGIFTRSIEGDKRFKTNSLPLNLQRAYEAANETRQALQRDISESLARSGLIEESLQYPAVTQSYAENVAPYFNKAIGDVVAGQKHPEKLAKRLREDEQFMIDLGDRYPELRLNKILPMATGAGLTGASLLAALLGLPKISHAKEKRPFLETENFSIYD